jgi:predicted DNA-binding protein (UPF0251 family)
MMTFMKAAKQMEQWRHDLEHDAKKHRKKVVQGVMEL